jgi:hypothetical protein
MLFEKNFFEARLRRASKKKNFVFAGSLRLPAKTVF